MYDLNWTYLPFDFPGLFPFNLVHVSAGKDTITTSVDSSKAATGAVL